MPEGVRWFEVIIVAGAQTGARVLSAGGGTIAGNCCPEVCP